MRDRWKLRLLVTVHVATGLVARGLVEVRLPLIGGWLDPAAVPFFAVPQCQAGLLGIWAAFSGVAWRRRLAGLVVGSAYLTLLLWLPRQEFSEMSLIAAQNAVTTAGILVVVRQRIAQLARWPEALAKKPRSMLRFSIRGLMLLTLAAALVAGAFRSMERAFDLYGDWFFWPLSTSFVTIISLSACWATLGGARTFARSLAVLILSFLLGAIFAQGVKDDWANVFYVLADFGLIAILSLASLLVVRSCGYRLVRRPATDPAVTVTVQPRSLGSCGSRS